MTADGLVEALHVAGPAGPNAEQLQLFGQFIGSWDIAWSGLDAGGRTQTARGELHFGWVLGGRRCRTSGSSRSRRARRGEPPLAFHGSTIRFYDASIGAWRSTWIDPVNGRVRRFVGRPVDGEIVLLSDEDDPQLRWRFTDIAPRLVHLARRGLPRRRRDVGARRGDEDHAPRARADGLAGALHAPEPDAARAEALAALRAVRRILGDRLVGPGCRRPPARSARGEAHFGWVLGGPGDAGRVDPPEERRARRRAELRRSTAPGSASTTPPSAPGAGPGWIR